MDDCKIFPLDELVPIKATDSAQPVKTNFKHEKNIGFIVNDFLA